MFIKNFSSINKTNIILVDEITRTYLQSLGYIPLSEKNGEWAYTKTDELLNILHLQKGGHNE